MRSWRQRGVEARERGEFLPEDFTDWKNIETCPAAEVVRVCGIGEGDEKDSLGQLFYHPSVHGLGTRANWLMYRKDFDAFDRLLDEMEDRALAIKRAST
jgi:hypothetical protein